MAKERPLLLKAPLIRATFDDRKTNTRRVIKPEWSRCLDLDDPEDIEQAIATNPYGQPGDRLYVRETWRYTRIGNYVDYTQVVVQYRADDFSVTLNLEDRAERDRAIKGMERGPAWRPGIHMPKIYSRLLLDIKKVWVERLHEITGDGAIAEGVVLQPTAKTWEKMNEALRDQYRGQALEHFREIWDKINGPRGFPWADNPHVFVVDYRVRDANHSH